VLKKLKLKKIDMTFKEAKDLLKKEGFIVKEGNGKPCGVSEWFAEYEDSEIRKAMEIVCSSGCMLMMGPDSFNERKARMKKEYKEKNKRGEKPKEKNYTIYGRTSPKADFFYKCFLKEGNPALEEAAKEFNDAMLDELQDRLKRQARVYDRVVETLLGELSRLRGRIKELEDSLLEKDEVLNDVIEELADKERQLSAVRGVIDFDINIKRGEL
jgi:hypothetical protein